MRECCPAVNPCRAPERPPSRGIQRVEAGADGDVHRPGTGDPEFALPPCASVHRQFDTLEVEAVQLGPQRWHQALDLGGGGGRAHNHLAPFIDPVGCVGTAHVSSGLLVEDSAQTALFYQLTRLL